jgi:leucyl aminopeptidase (aminopeptidase T)
VAPGGTDLSIGLDSQRHRWISNRGVWRPGSTVILPAGEVATYPASVDGVLVADFAFNVNAMTQRDSRLDRNPIRVWIEDGRAVRFQCEDAGTSSFLEECFSRHYADNVGEIGFGTNHCIESSIELNSHINERRPGVHLGFGQHNQDPDVVQYQCDLHLDLIARGGSISVDGGRTFFDLENIIPSRHEHPTHPRSEDIFGAELDDLEVDDCCGLLTETGLQMFKN